MAIVFNPPLDTATVLAIPPSYQDGAELDVCFTATFDSVDELAKLEHDNVQIELWSNIPVSGRPVGDWGALKFCKTNSLDGITTSTVNRRAQVLRLSPLNAPSPDAHDPFVLQLAFTTQVPTGATQYKYTYRLIHPDGSTEWLGQYGRDGVLLIERADPRITPAPTMDWTYGSGQASLQLSQETSEVEVAQLNTDLDWSSWVVDSNGHVTQLPSLPNLACSSDTSLLVLLSSTPQTSFIESRPLLITASHPHSFSVSPTGSIKARSSSSSPTSIHLRTHEGRTDLRAFAQEVLVSSKSPLRLLSTHPESGHALLVTPTSEQTCHSALIPFASSKKSAQAEISLSELAKHLSLSPEEHICVCDTDHLNPIFLSSTAESLCFETGPIGGCLLAAPSYHLPGKVALSVALLGSHEKTEAEVIESSPVAQTPLNSLPSPPPTPDRINKGLLLSDSKDLSVGSTDNNQRAVVNDVASVLPPPPDSAVPSSDNTPVTPPPQSVSLEREKHTFPSSPKTSNSSKDGSLAEFMSFPPTPGALFAKAAACLHDRHSPQSFVGAVMGGILRRTAETAENDLPPSRRALGRRMSQVGLRASSPSLSPTMDRLTLSPLRSSFNLDEPSYFPEVTPVQEEKVESPVKVETEEVPPEVSSTQSKKTEDHLLSPLKLTTPLKGSRPTLTFHLGAGSRAVCIRPETPIQASTLVQSLIVRLDGKHVVPDVLDVHNGAYLLKIPGDVSARLTLSLKED